MELLAEPVIIVESAQFFRRAERHVENPQELGLGDGVPLKVSISDGSTRFRESTENEQPTDYFGTYGNRRGVSLVPCGASFWSAFCSQNDSESSTKDFFSSSNNIRQKEAPNRLLVGGLEFEVSEDKSRPKASPLFPNSEWSFPLTPKEKGRKTKIKFSPKHEYFSPSEPLTEEEKKSCFWSEAECRQMKEERRAALICFKDYVLRNHALLWDDDSEESIRGLEDHTAELLGHTNSYYTRRDHMCCVLGEFRAQQYNYLVDINRLRKASERSSLLSSHTATERARSDHLAVA
eukprot:CAMPEP_0198151430 /NCGR_PEP_ID=MMETSP1443-20131203/55544_1 /TAXON_ID=186043 /ORGANISM="Entomoneis sp., Strain CCMP2396" /LENGTH=291 /DNA_ID=CAMNT_0043817081 /DNA_START=23 /DNA_END=898 /DNA_ORIENTATION=-